MQLQAVEVDGRAVLVDTTASVVAAVDSVGPAVIGRPITGGGQIEAKQIFQNDPNSAPQLIE